MNKKKNMAKKVESGTLSTKASADKATRAPKETGALTKMKHLLGLNRVRVHSHANTRMGERKVIYFEVLQALGKSSHEPKRDRYSEVHASWEYSFIGTTLDKRRLRIGIAFEFDQKSNERLLIITVIDPDKEDE